MVVLSTDVPPFGCHDWQRLRGLDFKGLRRKAKAWVSQSAARGSRRGLGLGGLGLLCRSWAWTRGPDEQLPPLTQRLRGGSSLRRLRRLCRGLGRLGLVPRRPAGKQSVFDTVPVEFLEKTCVLWPKFGSQSCLPTGASNRAAGTAATFQAEAT